MSRIAYVNGVYVSSAHAEISINDRGLQFSDGVYEVVFIANGGPVDLPEHLDRLDTSLDGLDIPWPMTRKALTRVLQRVVELNRVTWGICYWQISRGIAPRSHVEQGELIPSLIVTARQMPRPTAAKGITLITSPERRWAHRDYKSVSLLPNVLAMREAAAQGGQETLFIDDDGTVTETGSANAWIVLGGNRLVTRPLSPDILPGITRARVLDLARDAGYAIEERPFTLEEALQAKEVFITSTTRFVAPVTRVDDKVIANGEPGEVAVSLRDAYQAHLKTISPENWADTGAAA